MGVFVSFISFKLSLFHIHLYTINTDKHPLVCKYVVGSLCRAYMVKRGQFVTEFQIQNRYGIRTSSKLTTTSLLGEKKLQSDDLSFLFFKHNWVNANFKNKFDVIQISRRSTRTQQHG